MNYNDFNSTLKLTKTKVTGQDAIFNSVSNIIGTEPGSLPGNPEFSCGLGKYLFEIIDPLTTKMMEEKIKYALLRWEPRITPKTINIIEDSDYNRLLVKISYIIKNSVDNKEYDLIYAIKKER